MPLRRHICSEVRKKSGKASLDAGDDVRRIHDDVNLIPSRKSRRHENLLTNPSEGFPSYLHSLPEYALNDRKLEILPFLVNGVLSNDQNKQLEAMHQFRKLLSIEQNPPIQDVIDTGVVPQFVEFLLKPKLPQLQFEAAWALTNIASGTSEHTKVVIDNGAIPILVELLSSPAKEVCEQAMWALGNVAGDSPKYRDLVLSHGIMIPLLNQLNEFAKLSMIRNATWALSNLCRGKPPAEFEQIKVAIPMLEQLVNSKDEDVIINACWALSYLSDGVNERIHAVLQSGVCQTLIRLLCHHSPLVLIPALRTVGNIVTGDDVQTQYMIDKQVLPSLLILLTQTFKKSIKKEACWTVSNITAGNKDHIQAVIEANMIPALVNLLVNAEFEIKMEAAGAISNATSGGTRDQINYLVNQGCIKPLCDMLTCSDVHVVTVCLEGLENILRAGETELSHSGHGNPYARIIDEVDGLSKLGSLQSHDDSQIYEKVVNILETYFEEEESMIG